MLDKMYPHESILFIQNFLHGLQQFVDVLTEDGEGDIGGRPEEEGVEEETVNLLQVLLGVAHARVAYESPMLSWQHIDMDLLDLLLLVEVGHDGLRTQSNRLVGVDVPARH